MNQEYFQEIGRKAHENDLDKGLRPATDQAVTLGIISELFEALSEKQAGHPINETRYLDNGWFSFADAKPEYGSQFDLWCLNCECNHGNYFKLADGNCANPNKHTWTHWRPFTPPTGNRKPEGVPTELADVVILCCGAIHSYGYGGFIRCEHPNMDIETLSIECCSALQRRSFGYVISLVLSYCEQNGIDIETAIAEKMAYNLTREFKHGKVI